jgi:hypothetical protein
VNFKSIALAGAAVALAFGATGAQAFTTISNGSYTVGIGSNGELFDYNSYIGFQRGDGYDPLAPGNPRDSWGVTTSAGSAFADQSFYGTSNIGGTSFAGGGSSLSATSSTAAGVSVHQSYKFVGGGNILKVTETITNTSGSTLTGVKFARNVDWDISPTAFGENTFGHIGSSSNVIDSSFYGFENPTAGAPYFLSCAGGCNATGDLGGGIQVALADLAPGASDKVHYYYGLSSMEENVNGLIHDAHGVGAKYIIATQSSENGAYPGLGMNSAMIAVSGGVPEPSTWATMLIGLGGLGAVMRNRRRAGVMA